MAGYLCISDSTILMAGSDLFSIQNRSSYCNGDDEWTTTKEIEKKRIMNEIPENYETEKSFKLDITFILCVSLVYYLF